MFWFNSYVRFGRFCIFNDKLTHRDEANEATGDMKVNTALTLRRDRTCPSVQKKAPRLVPLNGPLTSYT